ncbi:glycosyltransferase [candidate division WOR-3 bacterium]|nr:glycosyltransferase [candidate division WOR-3 bacterium]
MSNIWINIQVITIVFLLLLLLIALSNTRSFRRLGDYPAPSRFPRVSILLPARNEERNIAACVRSLLAQDYPDFEVIVIDDESTDRTWEVLEGLTKENKSLKIRKGEPLPRGWIGKHWACHQLVEVAGGELFLFTDADTRHHPNTLREAVAAFEAEEADFLTALPREEAKSLGEKLTIPVMSFGINSFLPVGFAHRTRLSAFCLAVGQFMLFRRKAYEKIGGYEAAKQKVLDDVWFGRRIKAHGLRWRIVDATHYISCRMYTNLGEVSEGFSKNLYATFNNNIPVYILVWLWLTTVFILPVFVLGLAITGVGISETSVVLVLITIGCSVILWGITHLRFHYPLYLTLLYPVIVFLWVLMAARSMVMTIAGKNTWKGRTLNIKEKPVEESEDLEDVRDRPA